MIPGFCLPVKSIRNTNFLKSFIYPCTRILTPQNLYYRKIPIWAVATTTPEMVTVKREFSSDSDLSPPPSDLEDEEEEEDSGRKPRRGGDETSKYFNNTSSSGVRQSSRKRKREDSTAQQADLPVKPAPRAARASRVKKEESPEYTAAKPSRGGGSSSSSGTAGKIKLKKFSPPAIWRTQYDAIKEMRLRIPAVVDTMGCERLAEAESGNITPKDQRFQTLIALVLSSQTKDTVTSAAMKRMQKEMPGGLKNSSILKLDEKQIDEYIKQVGFHNKKSVFIKKISEILRDKYDDDIPDTIEGMTSLPGVGPKMAYLCMAVAWKRVEGIGVDTHVHRIANMLKWVPNTPNPETTRAYLESWLPKELWHEINWLLVGFGQTICPPRGKRCWECNLGPKSTGGMGICRAAVVPDVIKRKIKLEAVEAKVKSEDDDDVAVKAEMEVKTEEVDIKTEDDGIKQEEISTTVDSVLAIKKEQDDDEEDASIKYTPDIEDIGVNPKPIVLHGRRSRRSNKRT